MGIFTASGKRRRLPKPFSPVMLVLTPAVNRLTHESYSMSEPKTRVIAVGEAMVVNGLKKIAGQAPLPSHKYSGWSFRGIIGQAGLVAQSDGLFHLSDMAKFIRHTPPYDSFQTGLVSWRNLLEPS